jgi:hypothetical protein
LQCSTKIRTIKTTSDRLARYAPADFGEPKIKLVDTPAIVRTTAELFTNVNVRLAVPSGGRDIMADGGGGASGVLGVLVGAMLVIFVGAAVLMATGRLGPQHSGPSFTIRLPGAK